MFNRLRKGLPIRGGGQSPKENPVEQKNEQGDSQAGFICPMCMAALPGPAELQIHFEKVHSDNGTEEDDEKLLDLNDDSPDDQTDALPDQIRSDLIASPVTDFSKSHLELTLDPNAPDTEKEVVFLQQELAELNSQLKEEKWYTGQLKIELDKVSKERDKLEEDKQMVEEEFSAQLRSAEAGYLQVAEENERLKQELTYADYKTTKERHEKLQQDLLAYKNDVDEERQRRLALEESFKLLQIEYNEEKAKTSEKERLLQTRPTDDVIENLKGHVTSLESEMVVLKETHKTEVEALNERLKSDKLSHEKETERLNATLKDMTLEKSSKEEQISSLQTAISSSSEATNISRQQLNEKQQQIIQLQKDLYELENKSKEKTSSISSLERELSGLRLSFANETSTNERLKEEINTYKNKLEEVNREKEKLDSHVTDLEGRVGNTKEDVQRLEKERIELIAKIEAGEGTDTVIQHLTQEKAKLLDTMTSLERSLNEQMKQHTSELDVFRREKSDVSVQLQQTTSDLHKSQTVCKEFETKYQVAQENIASLKEDLKTKNDDYFKMESNHACEKNDLNDRINELNHLNVEKDGNIKVFNEKISQLSEELSKSHTNQAQQSSWIETKNNAIAEMTGRLSSYQEQLNSKTSEIASLNQTAMEKEKAIEKLNVQSSNQQKQIMEFEQKLADVQKQHDELKICFDTMKAEKESLEKIEAKLLEVRDELSKEIERLKNDMKTKEEEMRNENEIMIAELNAKHKETEASLMLQIQTLTTTSEETESVFSDAKKNLEAEIIKRNEADKMILDLEGKYSKIEKSLEQKDDILRAVQADLEVAQKELKKPCESCKNYEVQLCRLQEATKDQSGQIERLNAQKEELDGILKKTSDELSRKTKELENARSEHQTKLEESSKTIDTLEQEKISSKEEVAALKLNVDSLTEEIATINGEKDEINHSFAQELQNSEKLNSEKNKLESNVLDLKADIELHKENLEKVREEMKKKEEEVLKKQNEHDTLMKDLESKLSKETEEHKESKASAAILQQTLKDESIALQNKLDMANVETSDLRQSKKDMEEVFRTQLEEMKNSLTKQQQEVLNRDRRIVEFEMKVKNFGNERNDLKGDISVLEAKMQNSTEEKKALLERVLQAEEQQAKTKQKLSDTNRRLDQALAGLQELGQENQNIQIQQQMKSTRQWEKDADVTSCKKCDKLFTLTVRKHHCRNCGCIFCKDCSSWSAVVASSKKPVRVCEHCSIELNNVRGTNVRRLSNASIQSTASSIASPYRP